MRLDLDDLSRELHLLDLALDGMMAAGDSSAEDLPALACQVLRCRELVSELQGPAPEASDATLHALPRGRRPVDDNPMGRRRGPSDRPVEPAVRLLCDRSVPSRPHGEVDTLLPRLQPAGPQFILPPRRTQPVRRGTCEVCGKALHDEPGPVLMDREGQSYHFRCWCKRMDVLIQKRHERMAERKEWLADARKKLRDRLAQRRTTETDSG